jgi:hypothetical protein
VRTKIGGFELRNLNFKTRPPAPIKDTPGGRIFNNLVGDWKMWQMDFCLVGFGI